MPEPICPPSEPSACSIIKPCYICCSPSRYSCPRCSLRTCSLLCSRTHKLQESCSGIRDPAKFIPLNEYTQGAWSDDYRWLEEGRRQVMGWGQEIKVDEVNANEGSSRGRGRGRGRKMNRGRARGKTDGLRRELEKRGCKADFMPEGMGRKKSNQSSWNPRTEQLHLTVHLLLPSTLLLPSASSEKASSMSVIKDVSHPRVLFATSSSEPLPTLSLLLPPMTVSTSEIQFLLRFHATPLRPAPPHNPQQLLFYPPLDPKKPLAQALEGSSWVEYPEIRVMENRDWSGMLEKGQAIVVALEHIEDCARGTKDLDRESKKRNAEPTRTEDSSVKKSKVDAGQSLLALGDYESDEESAPSGGKDISDKSDSEGADVSLEMLEAVGQALVADLVETE
ncbi:hypothetical protein L204_100767 [Cryptococcus depauperatus]|nr:hypothetical protein L204_01301 [Cryptococcus depauperatus CBS 7855]